MRKPRERVRTRGILPLQVAAVCYRRHAGATQFLLVRTSSGRWTFPKGRLEEGLSHAEVAALEAFEEGGVEGKVHPRPVGMYLHRKESLRGESKEITVVAFVLEAKSSALPAESHRRPRWFSAGEVKLRLANRRSERYLRGLERVFDAAVQQIARKHTHE
jgi:8-oxo-dGTP pyrophosphatase MutT (NUDIX family)